MLKNLNSATNRPSLSFGQALRILLSHITMLLNRGLSKLVYIELLKKQSSKAKQHLKTAEQIFLDGLQQKPNDQQIKKFLEYVREKLAEK